MKVNINSLGFNRTKAIIGCTAVIVATVWITVSYVKQLRHKVAAQEAELATAKIEFQKLAANVWQANNTTVQSQKELQAGLSKDMLKLLKDQELRILQRIDGQIEAGFERHSGNGGTQLEPGLYRFPKAGQTDPHLEEFIADLRNPDNLAYSYQLKPLQLNFAGVLGFDAKLGAPKFWLEPVSVNQNGVTITTKRLELKPNEDFNAWMVSLRGRTTSVPQLPKYTVGITVGREYSVYYPDGRRSVFGGDLTYNFGTPLSFFGQKVVVGAGGGVNCGSISGSSVYGRMTFSFGAR